MKLDRNIAELMKKSNEDTIVLERKNDSLLEKIEKRINVFQSSIFEKLLSDLQRTKDECSARIDSIFKQQNSLQLKFDQ